MNGKVVFSTSRASNCVSSVLPSVSAVMPVPSETKKTDRCVMARSFRSFRRPRQHQGHDETAGGPLLYHWRPLRALTALFSFRTAPGMDSPHVFQPEPAVQNPDHKRDSIVTRNVIWYSELGMNDVEIVGGKNASLGEMIANLAQSGVRVPNGFATTADAYRQFLTYEGLAERINSMLAKLDIDDVAELARTGKAIREAVLQAPFPEALDQDIRANYQQLIAESVGPEISETGRA